MLTKAGMSLLLACVWDMWHVFVLTKLWQKPPKRNGNAEDSCYAESHTAGSWEAF